MTTRLARRLAAPAPGWTARADAGLTATLELRTRVPHVLLVTKGELVSGATAWAQGGIAAALAPTHAPATHLRDTLVAGVGLCDLRAVEVLVTEGPARVRELVARGAATEPDGHTAVTREGGHQADRVAHTGGAATGTQRIAGDGPGALRSAAGLAAAGQALLAVRTDAHRATDGGERPVADPQVAEWETTNVHQVATVLTATAATRRETRGGHVRTDHPASDDAWLVRVEAGLDPDGTLVLRRGAIA